MDDQKPVSTSPFPELKHLVLQVLRHLSPVIPSMQLVEQRKPPPHERHRYAHLWIPSPTHLPALFSHRSCRLKQSTPPKAAPIHISIQRHRLKILSRKLVDLLLMEMYALVNMAVSAALVPARPLVTRHVNTAVDVVLHGIVLVNGERAHARGDLSWGTARECEGT
jgi:hypothetical protein